MQGTFKEPCVTSDILTGAEFKKPFENRPPDFLVTAGIAFFSALTPGLETDVLCDEPWYWATLVRLLPIRPRSRCARRSLRTFPVVALHPRFPFNVRLTGKTFD